MWAQLHSAARSYISWRDRRGLAFVAAESFANLTLWWLGAWKLFELVGLL